MRVSALTDGGWRPHTDGMFDPSKVSLVPHTTDTSQLPYDSGWWGPFLPMCPAIISEQAGLELSLSAALNRFWLLNAPSPLAQAPGMYI